MAKWEIDYWEGIKNIENALEQVQNPEEIINEVLHGIGAEEIETRIIELLPRSNRKWKGKKAHAKDTMPFKALNENLSVTVKTKPAYHYLYFPDDGSSSRKHAGNLQFMQRGGEASVDTIIEEITNKIIEQINK